MKTRVLVILFIALFSNSTMASSNDSLRKSRISKGLRVIQNAEKHRKDGYSKSEAIGYLDDKTGMYKLNPNFKQKVLADFRKNNPKNRWLNVFENPHDDRKFITERAFPYSTIGKISFKKGSEIFTCSGTLVGPRHVATAAHCIQDDFGNQYAEITFFPNMINNESPDQASWTTYYSSPDLPTYSTTPTTNLDQDWALLILDQDLGYDYGWLGMDRNIAVGDGIPGFGSDTIFDAGYSADRSFVTASITDVCEIKKLGSDNQEIYHSCDLQGGASGGPLGRINFLTGNHYVVGVNAYEKCEEEENPSCTFTNYLDDRANVAVSIDEIRCSLSMDLENYSYDLCRRGSTIQHVPDHPIPECAGHNHCNSGEYCSNFKICHFCNDCSSFTSIDGSCFGACNKGCDEHADCDVHNYCDKVHNCFDCNSCELYNDSIDGKCRECLSPTNSPTPRPTYKPSPLPTVRPTLRPTIAPSFSPSAQPTSKPSLITDFPTQENFVFTSFPTFSSLVEEENDEISNSFTNNSPSSSKTWLYAGTVGGVFTVAAMTGIFVWKKCFKKSPGSQTSQSRIPDLERQEIKTDILDGKKAMELEEVILDTWAAGDAADVIKLVLKITKENCNYQTKDDKWSPIMILAGLAGAKSTAIAIQEAKFSGSDPAIKDNYGWNALHWAAYYGNAEAAMELVEDKKLLDATDNFGLTPLKTAELEGNNEVVKILRHAKR